MERNAPQMDDATLHAYVDGQLAAEEAAQVAQWLQQHPHDAARVLDWQAQRSQLRALQLQVLDEPVPPRLLRALQPRVPAWRFGLAAAVMLGIGVGLGWWLRPLLAPDAAATATAAPAAAPAVPAFVRDAGVAHALYTPERLHAVEVSAAQQDHLVQWLSKRLGAPLRVPVLTAQGFSLIGGRLLPAGDTDPSFEGRGARAQFMYESAGGERLTLYVSVFNQSQPAPTAFRFASVGGGGAAQHHSFYWLDGRLGYALTGPLSRDALATLATQVYGQLR